jgi:hypothetical protein
VLARGDDLPVSPATAVVPAALDAAAILTSRVVCPVSGDVADTTILP